MEVEENNELHFMDLTLTKLDDKQVSSDFHKPTHTDTVINISYIHPYSHKIASFFHYIHRLLSDPVNTMNYNKELNLTKQITINNYHNPEIIFLLRKLNTRKL